MWDKYKYYILSGIALILIGVLEASKPKQVIWLESYSKHDKIPYGNFVLFQELGSVFTKSIISSTESLPQALNGSMSNTNLIVINSKFTIGNAERDALLEFVNNGNQVFIAGRSISQNLLDTLGLKLNYGFDDELKTDVKYYLKEDTTSFGAPVQNSFFRTYFDKTDKTELLGFTSDDKPNFISSSFGKGRFFLHLTPSIFSNVFMLSGENHRYISNVLSYLPDQNTIWDEFYKERKNYIARSPFEQVLATDGLRQALQLMLIGMLLYMIFASKRKQRVIPVLPVKSNSTLEFVETIGQLYYNESNHKDIGMKRINYFLADIREKYRLDTEVLDEKFAHKLSNSSGVPFEDVNQLVTNFRVINAVADVLDERIAEQDKLIENFYTKARSYGK